MKKHNLTCLVALLFSYAGNVYSHDLSHQEIADLARYICSTELKKGQHYKIAPSLNGGVEFRLLGKKGAALKGTLVYEKAEWEEQQKVLSEHQIFESIDHRECVVGQVDSLRKKKA